MISITPVYYKERSALHFMLANNNDPSNITWKTLLQSGQQGAGEIRRFHINQRGRGFGSVLTKLIRLFPVFLSSPVGKQLLNSGKDVITNIKEGDDISTSIAKTSRAKVREMTGLGKRRKRGRKAVQKGGSRAKLLGFVKNRIVRRKKKKGGRSRRAFITPST